MKHFTFLLSRKITGCKVARGVWWEELQAVHRWPLEIYNLLIFSNFVWTLGMAFNLSFISAESFVRGERQFGRVRVQRVRTIDRDDAARTFEEIAAEAFRSQKTTSSYATTVDQSINGQINLAACFWAAAECQDVPGQPGEKLLTFRFYKCSMCDVCSRPLTNWGALNRHSRVCVREDCQKYRHANAAGTARNQESDAFLAASTTTASGASAESSLNQDAKQPIVHAIPYTEITARTKDMVVRCVSRTNAEIPYEDRCGLAIAESRPFFHCSRTIVFQVHPLGSPDHHAR